jgi:hypothetical protein
MGRRYSCERTGKNPDGGLTSPPGRVSPASAAQQRNADMKFAPIAAATLALTLASAVGPAPADAKGCLKGALVGGVAGHYAGHHAVLGALGGCVVGHHLANEKDKQRAAASQGEPAPQATAPHGD